MGINKKCSHLLCQMPQFEGEEKCIFHCEKNEENGWCTNSNDKYEKFNLKVSEFWRQFVVNSRNESANDAFRCNDFVIPFYHQNLTQNSPLDISRMKRLRFDRCVFADAFNISNFATEELWVYGCKFTERFAIFDSEISKFVLGGTELWKGIRVSCCEIGSIVIDDVCSAKKVAIDIDETKVNNRIEVNRLKCENIEFNIAACSLKSAEFQSVEISGIGVNARTRILESIKVADSVMHSFSLEEAVFEKNSSMFIERCEFQTFTVHRTANNCDLISLADMVVKLEFGVDWFEGRKLALSNVVLKDCDIVIENSNLSEIMLGTVEWGDDLSKIQCSSDVIRQIKSAYDKIGNYAAGNRFFAEEMKRYRTELKAYKWISWRFQEKLIFHINGAISNYGHSYIRPILLIVALIFPARLLLTNTIFDLFPNGDPQLLHCYNDSLMFMNELAATLTPLKTLQITNSEFGSLMFALVFSILLWHTYTAAKRHSKR